MRRYFPLILFLTAILFPAALHAQSQDDNDPSYSDFKSFLGNNEEENAPPATWQYGDKQKPQYIQGTQLLPQSEQYMYLVRKANTSDYEAILRLVTPMAINGCVNIIPPKVTIRESGNTLNFKIERGSLALDKSVRYAHYQCRQGPNSSAVDIILNRNQLENDKIKTLSFQSANGGSDSYEVVLDYNRLHLVPRTSSIFKPFTGSTKADPLFYVFYPENTLILYAPSASKNADLGEQITALAQSKGLSPTAGTQDLKTGSMLYFTDESGSMAGSLAFDANILVGAVKDGQKPVDVYAKRPGMLD